jgi:UDP-N-acetylmuramoyl-tripeptide--D-alanyl-D-alanine ligase
MIALDAAVTAIGAAAGFAAMIRFLRVAQREHYLVGSVIKFAWRWWFRDPADASLAALAIGGAIASGFAAAAGFASGVVVALGPIGMGLRGRTAPLRWTRRLRTIAGLEAALFGAIVGAVSATSGLRGAATATVSCAVGVPLLLELALISDQPIESLVARRYVRAARARLDAINPLVVGVTGSFGKTSTKLYLEQLLAGSKAVVASPRSFNNQAGLARAVNETLTSGTEVFIAEMGTYGPGEIAAMGRWLRPSVAAITAIGPVHLERFRTLERTLVAKSEIALTATTVVLNADDARLLRLADQLRSEGKRVIECSASGKGAEVSLVAGEHDVEVLVSGVSVGRVPIDPRKPVGWENVACALGLARAIGMDASVIVDRLRSLPAVEHRLTVNESAGGVIVLDDTYNSNPAGARLALRALLENSRPDRRRVVVTPGMVELGAIQDEANRDFAAELVRAGAELVVVGATNRRALLAGAAGSGASPTVVSTREEAVSWVRSHLEAGDAVLYENDLPDHYP